jgi:methionyl-tRNA formyltransferase
MERPHNAAAGSVVFVSKNTLHLATGDGALAIEQLQPAGKKPMPVADFLNGQKLTSGQLFTVPAD